jgi:PAS domain S-box-containing protein
LFKGENLPGIEYTARRKDGTTFPIVMHANRIMRDDRPVGLRGIIIDLTQRKEAETLLRESEERFRASLDANPDPVVLYDGQGRVAYFNPAFTTVFGWSMEERMGKKMDLFVPEKNWPETKMMIETVLAGKPVLATETCRYDRQGNIIPVVISGAIIHDRTGQPVGSIINIRDIREQKKLQSQLAQAQRMEAIGCLVGGIAHDFNNILSAIMGYTELSLTDSIADPLLKDNLRKVKEAGERARDLVKQILTFSRQGEHALIPVQLGPIVMETFNLLRASLPTIIEIKYQVR